MTVPTGHTVVIVTGDRHATLERWGTILWFALTEAVAGYATWTLSHGNQRGIDQVSEAVARSVGTGPNKVRRYDADWQRYGRNAGPIRNTRMLTEAACAGREHDFPVTVLAFHDDLWGESRGTRDCVLQAKKLALDTWHYQSDGVITHWPPAGPEEVLSPTEGIRPSGRRQAAML